MKRNKNKTLFPTDLPGPEWVEFEAAGFERPVVGVIYRYGQADHGMSLGSVGTGYVNLDTDGTLGRYTLFNRVLPRPLREMNAPFLGLSVGERTWVLCKEEMEEVGQAEQIHYWGHFPVADLEYETDAPVSVGLRAWTPFLPGDSAGSNTPGAVFEAHLRNSSAERQQGTLAFSFPGPSEVDAMGKAEWDRQTIEGELTGVMVGSKNVRLQEIEHSSYLLVLDYALGVVGNERVRSGGALGKDASSWSNIAAELPRPEAEDAGASVAVDFTLGPGEEKVVRFVLGWYAPRWHPQQYGDGAPLERRCYFHAYGLRFESAKEVAEHLARDHQSLLRRVLGWQAVVYGEERFPGWLRDSLLNTLVLVAQSSFWVRQPTKKVYGEGAEETEGDLLKEDHWYGSEGLFSMNESLPTCPHPGGGGGGALLYFFPELVQLSLRGKAYYQRFDGEISMDFGVGTHLEGPYYGAGNIDSQPGLSESGYVAGVHALWQRTGDDDVLRRFYPSAKGAVNFVKSLDRDGDGLAEAREFRAGVAGAASFESSVWLAALRILERMAEHVGDEACAWDCRTWYALASRSVEEKLWNDEVGSYLFYHDTRTGRRSNTVSAFQLSGEGMMPGVFPAHRVREVLETFKRLNIATAAFGMRTVARPDGSEDDAARIYGGIVLGSVFGPMALMLRSGESGSRELALEVVRQCWHAIVIENGRAWNMPGGWNPSGLMEESVAPVHRGWYMEDYITGLGLWSLPAAILGQDIKAFCGPGGLVDRILKAARV